MGQQYCTYCTQCGQIRNIKTCYKDKKIANGLTVWCKECIKKDALKRYHHNAEHHKKRMKEYGYGYRKTKKCIERVKQYRKDNIERLRELDRLRSKTEKRKTYNCKLRNQIRNTVRGKLDHRISNAVRKHLRNEKNGRSWKLLLPYTTDQLRRRLKKTMPEGFTWDDFLSGKLHIDHKIPLSAFQYKKPEDLNFQKAWGLKNLQLLPAIKNLKKSNKIKGHFQQVLPIRLNGNP